MLTAIVTKSFDNLKLQRDMNTWKLGKYVVYYRFEKLIWQAKSLLLRVIAMLFETTNNKWDE